MFDISVNLIIGFILIISQIYLSATRGFEYLDSNKKLLLISTFIFVLNCAISSLFSYENYFELTKTILFSSTIYLYFLVNLLLKFISQKYQKRDFSISLLGKNEEYFGDKHEYTLIDKVFSQILILSSVFITLGTAEILFRI